LRSIRGKTPPSPKKYYVDFQQLTQICKNIFQPPPTFFSTLPYHRHEVAKDVESIREIASAEKIGASAYEDNVPHRNDLPAREALPYRPPNPTFGELLGQQLRQLSKSKQPAKSPSNVDEQTLSGNQTETHGNLQ